MDTYVHIAIGAAVGDAISKLVDRKRFNGEVFDETQKVDTQQKATAFGIVTISGAVSAILSHLIADLVPHGDYLVSNGILLPNKLWPVREFFASLFTFIVIGFLTRGKRRIIALICGLFGGLPDIESLFIGVGLLNKSNAIFPVHNGLLPHGKRVGFLSFLFEFGALISALVWYLANYRKKISSQ